MYHIYHIPGIKVGCTSDLKRRIMFNRKKYGEHIAIEILKTVDKKSKADMWEAYYHSKLGYGIIKISDRYLVRTRVANSNVGTKRTDESKQKMSDRKKNKYKGKDNSTYGKGLQYRELTTGVTGYLIDLKNHFGMSHNGYIATSIRKGKPLTSGKYKGLHFTYLSLHLV